jgi:hypothetical protein
MDQCVEQRKTTLTDAVAGALREVIQGREPGGGWGIELDVVQVAQVFVVDPQLRRQLEAEVRNSIKVKSDLSEIRTQEGIKLAQAESERRLKQEELTSERERVTLAREKLRLQRQLERDEIETETPVRLLKIQNQAEVLRQEMDKAGLETQLRQHQVQKDLLLDRAKQDLRKEILPLEQVPSIAASLAQLMQGVNLSVYGSDTNPLASVGPLVDLLSGIVRQSLERQAAGTQAAGG